MNYDPLFESWWKCQKVEALTKVPAILIESYKEVAYKAWLSGFEEGQGYERSASL